MPLIRLTEESKEFAARQHIYLGRSMTYISQSLDIPSSTINDFLNRKTHPEFWKAWDEKEYLLTHKAEKAKKDISELKIFVYDIETAPMIGAFWGLFKNNIPLSAITQDWFIMTWAGKWFGEEEIYSDSCFNYGFDPAAPNDKPVVESLWAMFEEADMVVAHNGNRFDLKKTTARAIIHGLLPHSPVKKIDTMLIAKGVGMFTSNKLEYLAQTLCGVGKMETGGMDLWMRCLLGDPEAWATMEEYNINDVAILEDVWVALAPYDKRSPSIATHVPSTITRCTSPACGSHNISETGKTVKTNVSEFTGYKCNECGKQMRGRKNIRSKIQMAATLADAL